MSQRRKLETVSIHLHVEIVPERSSDNSTVRHRAYVRFVNDRPVKVSVDVNAEEGLTPLIEREYRGYLLAHLEGAVCPAIEELCYEAEIVASRIRTPRMTEHLRQRARAGATRRLAERLGSNGRPAEYDLSDLRDYYTEVKEQVSLARRVYKASGKLTRWREHVRLEVPEMPEDLIRRLSGNPQDLTDHDMIRLEEQGGTAQPSDIALEWAARLCGVPPYHYKLKTLKAKLTEQNKDC